MTKEKYLQERSFILKELKEITSKKDKLTAEEREASKELRTSKEILDDIYIKVNSPVKVGEKFFCITANGRKLKGVADELSVMNGNIFVSSYYPVVNGTKKGNLAFISFPPQKLIRI